MGHSGQPSGARREDERERTEPRDEPASIRTQTFELK